MLVLVIMVLVGCSALVPPAIQESMNIQRQLQEIDKAYANGEITKEKQLELRNELLAGNTVTVKQ